MNIDYIILLAIVFIFIRYHFPIIVTYKLHRPDARKPDKAYHKAACWDVFSVEDRTIPPGEWREISTGVSFAPWPHIYIPKLKLTITPFGNVAFKLHTRSGLAINRGLRNHLGIIDNDYREVISVIMFNHGPNPARIKPGHKIGQLEFYRVSTVFFWKKDELSNSLRGRRGLGSSGK
jgi:deoxyuridine 5'-triphosphate nucleotidohydrolase